MSKKTVFTVLLLLFLISTSVKFMNSARASRTWTVDDDGPADFHTIQEAVDAASNGDTVLVYSGTYFEHVSVNKTILLIGENPFDTIINAQASPPYLGYLYAVLLKADNITVSNLAVCNSMTGFASYYEGGGIYLHSSHGCHVENCIATNNGIGINLYDSSYNDISNNLVIGNPITVWDYSSNNLIRGNWFINNSYNGNGMDLGVSSKNSTIVENYFWDSPLYINSLDPSGSVDFASGVIAHNNFMQNASIFVYYYSGEWPKPDVAWSKDGEGNFWLNYSGQDTNGDGIGDTPYVIDELNNDSLPLMKPYNWLQGDVNYDTVVNIVDISIIAKAFGSRLGGANWNPRCDLNDDNIINILDLSGAATSFGKRMMWSPS
jgi:nitrous oxidase accessory protein